MRAICAGADDARQDRRSSDQIVREARALRVRTGHAVDDVGRIHKIWHEQSYGADQVDQSVAQSLRSVSCGRARSGGHSPDELSGGVQSRYREAVDGLGSGVEDFRGLDRQVRQLQRTRHRRWRQHPRGRRDKAGKSNFVRELRLVSDSPLSECDGYLELDNFWDGLDESGLGASVGGLVHLTNFTADESSMPHLFD